MKTIVVTDEKFAFIHKTLAAASEMIRQQAATINELRIENAIMLNQLNQIDADRAAHKDGA